MNLKLLLISADSFPAPLIEYMGDYGFKTIEARGRLKVKSLLETEPFDTIVWCHEGYEINLAQDILTILNQRGSVPLILLTGNFESPLIEADIQGAYGVFDLAEEATDLLRAIESACRKPQQEGENLQEIDFKNLVRQVTGDKTQLVTDRSQTFKLQSAWIAVDGNEKRLLSMPLERSPNWLQRLARWLLT